MKNAISKIVIGLLGVCIGFALCYFAGWSPDSRSVVVKVAPNGSLLLSGAPVELSQLSARLEKQGAYRCTIDVHPSDGYQQLVGVIDACKAAGVSQISVRTPWALGR